MQIQVLCDIGSKLPHIGCRVWALSAAHNRANMTVNGRREMLPTVRLLTWLHFVRCALRTCCGQSELRARAVLLEHRQRVRPRCPDRPPCTMAMRSTATPPFVARRFQTARPEKNNIARCMPAWAYAHVRERGKSMVCNVW